MSFAAFSLVFLGVSHAAQAAKSDTAASSSVYLDLQDTGSVLANTEAAFRHWLTFNERPYATNQPTVFAEKLNVFQANALHVHQHNTNPHASFSLKLNEFSDLTFEEFQATRLGYKPELSLGDANTARIPDFRHGDVSDLPDDIDWTTLGAVTPVKNQGACGSCWAFSTTGAIEGADFLTTKKLRSLSEQELVDCDREKDGGCNGGLMDQAFKYVVDNGGLDTEYDYRYWGSMPSFCNRRKQADRHVVDITGFEDVPSNDEHALAQAVSQQPVSVAICANRALQFYHRGVFDGSCCTALNHGVLAVGYGEDEEHGKYWKVKNSWGASWGEGGFFRLKKDLGGPGQCGVAMVASYPVKDDEKDPIVPSICDPQLFSLFECPADKSCNCTFNFLGLLCIAYDCQPKETVRCEEDGDSWCPLHAPGCSMEEGRCYDDKGQSVEMLRSQPAGMRGVFAA